MPDGGGLSTCSPKCARNSLASLPTADMSTPELGSTSISLDPFKKMTWMWMVGAALSVVTCLMCGSDSQFSVLAQVMVFMPLRVFPEGDDNWGVGWEDSSAGGCGKCLRDGCYGIPLPCGQLFGNGSKSSCKQSIAWNPLDVVYHYIHPRQESALLVVIW